VTFFAVAACIVCQLCLAGGQLLLKHAMDATDGRPKHWTVTARRFSGGIFLLSLWFFLWLGLLRDWELSRVYPFEALSLIMLSLGAWLFLKERLSLRTWMGIALIGTGITLVAGG
jgi:uncharacterized membrane protein